MAGFVSGLSILFLGKNVRHDGLAIYIFIRSLTLLVRCGNRSKRRWLLYLLWPTRLKHGDTLLVSFTGAHIVYAFIMAQHTLSPPYKRFLERQVNRDQHIIDAIKVRFFF